jgi:histidine triad (HIT) family protein
MNDDSKRCLFCRIARREAPGKIVFEDDSVVAFEDLHPRSPTHVLIIPRKHIESLDAMQPEDEAVVGHLHAIAALLARQHGIHQTGYRTVINTGDHAGQSVFHIHLHLMGGRSMAWPPG